MNRSATFTVPGTPAPQPRPRASGKCVTITPEGRRIVQRGHAYTPDGPHQKWKADVRAAWKASGQPPFLRHLGIRLQFTFQRPPSHVRVDGGLRKSAPREHVSRPDVDNLAKAVMDALGDAEAFTNDAAVTSLAVSKAYGETPGCLIVLTERD